MAAIPLLEETSGGPAGSLIAGIAGLPADAADLAHLELTLAERPLRRLAI